MPVGVYFPRGSPINACSQVRQDMDTQTDQPGDEFQDMDTTCSSCNKDLDICHFGTQYPHG